MFPPEKFPRFSEPVFYRGVKTVRVLGDDRDSEFFINGTLDGVEHIIEGGGGNDSINVGGPVATGLNVLTINTGTGDDSVTLNFTSGNPIPAGGIKYDGGEDIDKITASTNANFTLSNASLIISGAGTVTFVGSRVEIAAVLHDDVG